MDIKFYTGTTAKIIMISALLAGIIIPLKDMLCKLLKDSKVVYATLIAFPVTMLRARLNPVFIKVFCKPFVPRLFTFLGIKPFFSNRWVFIHYLMDIPPIKERFVADLKSHSFKRRMISFFHSLIPCRDKSKLLFATIRMMAPDIFRKFSLTPKPYRVEGLSTSTLTNCFFGFSIIFTCLHGYSLFNYGVYYTGNIEGSQEKISCELLGNPKSLENHNVIGNDGRDGYKNSKDWTISNQAAQEWAEGSTTRAWSPERTVKLHERTTGNGRYGLIYRETDRAFINS